MSVEELKVTKEEKLLKKSLISQINLHIEKLKILKNRISNDEIMINNELLKCISSINLP